MASGYTHGIIDGEIKSFKEFAFTCIRAFGATIHMRDDNSNAEYRPREVSNHYPDALQRTHEHIEKLKNMSDEDFEKGLVEEWNRRVAVCNEEIEKKKQNGVKLHQFLSEAKAYVPPTPDHEEFKKFMVEQLEGTIDYDADISYYLKELKELSNTLKSYNIEELRAERMAGYEKDLEYYERELNSEITRTNESNKWVADVFKSFE